ncbi:response regulator transcription factor [Streptomyces sp. BR123]|uniref:response regulator transcription factor n=1 Tax=Streptomyces sp. BR123 TaxID=2749828 RepID=UPI0015C48BA4|nr:response regulator transcription factor [Streptomyces sp. BR123]NXY98521.1 response regulator transcription factor [Streptomyces sp. BR123]
MDETPRSHRPPHSLRVLLWPPDPALAVLLGLQPDIEVVSSPLERPAVAVVDDVPAVAEVMADDPECRVLVTTGSAHPGLLDAVLASGASGLVLRDGPPDDLADAIRRAAQGETVVDPALRTGS